MTAENKFDVFAQVENGPLWRGAYPNLEVAKVKAQQLAVQEGVEFFILDFSASKVVARFFPRPGPRTPRA